MTINIKYIAAIAAINQLMPVTINSHSSVTTTSVCCQFGICDSGTSVLVYTGATA